MDDRRTLDGSDRCGLGSLGARMLVFVRLLNHWARDGDKRLVGRLLMDWLVDILKWEAPLIVWVGLAIGLYFLFFGDE